MSKLWTETKASNLAQFRVIQKLASWFGISKDKLTLDVNNSNTDQNGAPSPLLRSDLLNEAGFRRSVYCVSGGKVNLKTLLDMGKFKSSNLWESFITGEGYLTVLDSQHYIMCLVLSGTVWVVYRIFGYYAGEGGIFICDKDTRLVIEPIENYLRVTFPKPS